MNFDYISEFCALAEVKKFSEAAEILYISQSSLSKHIKNLETELGAQLFFRTAHSVVLTDFGREFLPYAKQLGEIQMKCNNNLLSKVKADAQNLSIGISPFVSLHALFEGCSTFTRKELGYAINIIQSHNEHLRQLLSTGKCQMIITTDKLDSDDEEFNVLEYQEDIFCVVLPEKSPLSTCRELDIASLEKPAFVQIGHNNLLANVGKRLKAPDFIAPNLCIAMDLIQQSQGFTICPSRLAQSHITDDFVMIPLVPRHISRLYLIYSEADFINLAANPVKSLLKLISPNLHH